MIGRNRKAQSTLEYVILVTAVIVVIIAMVGAPNSPFRQQMNKTVNTALNGVDDMTTKWRESINQ